MRLIDGDALLANVKHAVYTDDLSTTIAVGICEEHIRAMQTVDAAPVKHGRWVENKYGYITCSICDSFPLEAMTGSLITMHYEPYESEYCPHCGAKMDLEE